MYVRPVQLEVGNLLGGGFLYCDYPERSQDKSKGAMVLVQGLYSTRPSGSRQSPWGRFLY